MRGVGVQEVLQADSNVHLFTDVFGVGWLPGRPFLPGRRSINGMRCSPSHSEISHGEKDQHDATFGAPGLYY